MDPVTITSDQIVSIDRGPTTALAVATLAAPQPWFVNAVTGNPTGESGPAVNEFTAFKNSAVYKCVKLIAGKIASLPLKTYRRKPGGRGSEEATDRSEYLLLLRAFNPNMTAMTGRETLIAHMLTWGNAYCQIVWDRTGTKVLALNPLGPDTVKPKRADDGRLVYPVYKRGTGDVAVTLESEEILHIPGLSYEGLVGYSPVSVAKSTIRAGLAQDRTAERFATRGFRPPGAIKFKPGFRFKDEQHANRWREDLKRLHGNEESDLSILFLEDGADWVALGVEPQKAQLLDSRKYSTKEICGIYNVPPHLIGDVDSSTSWGTGMAEQTQGFMDYCLLYWINKVEAELNRKLGRDDPDVYYRHCVEEMLRGNFTARTAALNTMHVRGILMDNEWRAIEHMNPVEGGDVRHIPLNETLMDEHGNIVSLTSPQPAALTDVTEPKEPAADPTADDAAHGDATSAASAGDIQGTALNGAQITGLLLVTDKVASGDYPEQPAEAILQASFPLMDKGLIHTIVGPLAKAAEKEPTEEQPPPPGVEPVDDQAGDPQPEDAPAPTSVGEEQAGVLAGKLRAMIVGAAGRCLRKEAAEAEKAAKQPATFVAWVDSFYGRHATMVADQLGPPVDAWAVLFPAPADYPARHVERSRAELLAAADGPAGEFPARVARVAERWQAERLADVAAEFQPGAV